MRMTEMTAVELSAAIRAGQVTAVEAVEEMLAGIEERDALYNCYVRTWAISGRDTFSVSPPQHPRTPQFSV